MNKFSIILPVYNGGEYVKECIHSILNQTVSGYNLIILDNKSTDGTTAWLQSLHDDRIELHVSETSLSMENNWGRIKDIKKNEFITIIGHDDILHPHYLEEMNLLIEKHPDAGLYQSHYSFINAQGNFLRHCLPMDEIQYGHEFLACQLARTMESMGTGYLMRSKDYDALGGIPVHYPNLIFADYELWVQLSLLNYKATAGRTCFSYRLHDSISKLTNGEIYQLAFEKYIIFLAGLKNENAKIKSVIEKYGYDMLMFHCESLAHRILKTPYTVRKIKVGEFVAKCKKYASLLIPEQSFEPSKKFRIGIAEKLDSNILSRSAFYFFKNLIR